MNLSKLIAATVMVAALTAGGAHATDLATAARRPRWAPAATAAIHPGVQTRTEGSQCTANFVFFDDRDVYLGQAAHCASRDPVTSVDGCAARSFALGTPVQITGASRKGTLVYSSWLSMQRSKETDADRCLYNDFALIRLHPADRAKVNPTIPFWGGPVGLARGTESGAKVYSYGNSSLRFGVSALSPKEGHSVDSAPSGWTHDTYTATPGVSGDSGSAFLDRDGRALGVLSTIQALPFPASNGVSDLRLALDYLSRQSHLRVRLATGTEPFSRGFVPPLPT